MELRFDDLTRNLTCGPTTDLVVLLRSQSNITIGKRHLCGALQQFARRRNSGMPIRPLREQEPVRIAAIRQFIRDANQLVSRTRVCPHTNGKLYLSTTPRMISNKR